MSRCYVFSTLAITSSLFVVCTLEGQNYLPVSSCFNELLRQHIDVTTTEQLSLATLAQVTENTYDSFKRDATFSAKYGFISGSSNYADFAEKRRDYYSLHKLDFQYYKAISLSSRTLGPEAYDVIKECIRVTASRSDGFHYVYSLDDSKAAAVQFFWRPPTNAPSLSELKVVDSTLENAEVVGKSFKGTLFAPTGYFSRYPRIGIASESILLRRIDESKVIRISLKVEPAVDTSFITIPPVPPPPKPIVVRTKLVPTNITHIFDGWDIGKPGKPGTRVHGTPECGDCDLMTYTYTAPGEVISVQCDLGEGSHWATKSCEKSGNDVIWIGRTNDGNHRTITLRVQYQKKVEEEVP